MSHGFKSTTVFCITAWHVYVYAYMYTYTYTLHKNFCVQNKVVNCKTMVFFFKYPLFMSGDQFKSCPTDEKQIQTQAGTGWIYLE